jgi:hypothetical protein
MVTSGTFRPLAEYSAVQIAKSTFLRVPFNLDSVLTFERWAKLISEPIIPYFKYSKMTFPNWHTL